MIPSKIRWLALCLALAGCGDKPQKKATLGEALPNIPLPPDAQYVGGAAGPDALQLTLSTPAEPTVVADYYRGVFKTGTWKLVNDAKDAEGAIVLLAHQKGPPMWVRVRKAEGGRGSIVELSGAVVTARDTAAKDSAS